MLSIFKVYGTIIHEYSSLLMVGRYILWVNASLKLFWIEWIQPINPSDWGINAMLMLRGGVQKRIIFCVFLFKWLNCFERLINLYWRWKVWRLLWQIIVLVIRLLFQLVYSLNIWIESIFHLVFLNSTNIILVFYQAFSLFHSIWGHKFYTTLRLFYPLVLWIFVCWFLNLSCLEIVHGFAC